MSEFYKLPKPVLTFDYESENILFSSYNRPGESIEYEIAHETLPQNEETSTTYFSTSLFSSGYQSMQVRSKSTNLKTIRSDFASLTFIKGLNPTVTNNLLTWSAPTNLNLPSYDILDSNNQIIISNLLDNFIDLSDSRIQFGTQNLTLKVKSPSVNIDYPLSRRISITKLEEISISYHPNNRSISWSQSPSATAYRIEIDDTMLHQNYLSTQSRLVILPSFSNAKIYEIKITPLNEIQNTITKTTRVFIVGGVTPMYLSGSSQLVWDTLSQTDYEIYQGEPPAFLTSSALNNIDLTTLDLETGNNVFRIKFKSEVLNENEFIYPFSEPLSLTKLSSPILLNSDKVNFNWTSSEQNVQFRLKIDNLSIDETTSQTFFPIPQIEGSHEIHVISIKAGLFIPSDPAVFSVNLTRLNTPTGNISTQIDGRYRITVDPVENATNYTGTIYYYNTIEQYNSKTASITESINLTNSNNFTAKLPRGYAMVVEIKAINISNYQYLSSQVLLLERFF